MKRVKSGIGQRDGEEITEQQQVEEALREREARLQLLTSQVPAIIWSTDSEFRITSSLGAGLAALNLRPNQVVGMDLFEYLQTDNPKSLGIAAHRRALEGASVSYEANWQGRTFQLYIEPLRNAEGVITGTLGVALDITERKRAEEELKNSREQLRALSAHLQSVREEERTLIAREIHDELGQALTGLKFDLSWLSRRLSAQAGGQANSALMEKIRSMSELIDSTIGSVRRISTELRPRILDDLGLTAAIEWQAQEFQARTGIICRCRLFPEDLSLGLKRATAIFRIFQEILTNVARHAAATEVDISLEEKAGSLILEVKDNGRGITESDITKPASLGILGMRERALFSGGEVSLSGGRGVGTVVTVRIPVGD